MIIIGTNWRPLPSMKPLFWERFGSTNSHHQAFPMEKFGKWRFNQTDASVVKFTISASTKISEFSIRDSRTSNQDKVSL